MDGTSICSKPIILWLADCPGWAYDSIVGNISKQLPQYEHRVYYWLHGSQDGMLFHRMLREADIVVSMYLLYQRMLPDRYKGRCAMMLTGMRPFEC